MSQKPEMDSQMPRSLDAEKILLGAILSDVKSSVDLFDALRDEDFELSPFHLAILGAMRSVREREARPDLLNVHDELLRAGKLEAAGGIGYVAELGDKIPERINLDAHFRLLREKTRLRAILHVTDRTRLEALESADCTEVLDRGIERLSEIARDIDAERDEGTSFRDAASRLLQNFDAGDALRIFTDIDALDAITGGLRPGELILVTGETGTGKTLATQQTRRRACRDGLHTLFCSAEMNAPHLISRELCAAAQVAPWKMRRAERITRDEMRALVQAAAHECTNCRILDGELSLGRIRRVARSMKKRTGMDLLILDYDELIEAPGKDEFEQQRTLARGAKSLAIELVCPVMLVSQLRKPLGGEDAKRPTLQRLYGSAAKCKHASVVIYVDREFVRELKGDETAARIVVLKNRDGKVGAIEAKFNVQTLRFESVQPADQTAPDSSHRDGKAAASGSVD